MFDCDRFILMCVQKRRAFMEPLRASCVCTSLRACLHAHMWMFDSDRLNLMCLLCAQKWRDADRLIPMHLLCVQKWRELIERFKDKVEDYNYGSLLRLDSSQGYTQENSTFCEHKFAPSSSKEFNGLRVWMLVQAVNISPLSSSVWVVDSASSPLD